VAQADETYRLAAVVGVVDPSVPIEHIAYAKAYAPAFEDIRAAACRT
jgi:hypothetical protein